MTSDTTHTLGNTPPMPRLIDSHCHLHDSEFYDDAAREAAYQQAVQAGIAMICVGTDVRSSRQAVQFALAHDHCYVAVGIHPHDAEAAGEAGIAAIRELLAEKPLRQGRPVIVGVGEIGLDYFYDNSARPAQQQCLQAQLQLAAEFQLPVSSTCATKSKRTAQCGRTFGLSTMPSQCAASCIALPIPRLSLSRAVLAAYLLASMASAPSQKTVLSSGSTPISRSMPYCLRPMLPS